MNVVNRQSILAAAAALCFAAPAVAADTNPMGTPSAAGSPSASQRSVDPNVNPGTAAFRDWTQQHAGQHQGRVTREDYMSEMERRWRAMDRGQGLTPAEIDRLHGWQPGVTQTHKPQQGTDNVKAD